MAKITRQNHKTFGDGGSTDNFAKFGSLVAGSALKTKDIDTIQSLAAWNEGFQSAIFGANKNLLLEDVNAWCFEHSRQVSYLFQAGIPEWQVATTYYKGSLVQRTSGADATGEIYQSLIDANTGNVPPVSASNANWLWVNPPMAIFPTPPTLNNIPKVTLVDSLNGVPGSAELGASNVSDDGNFIIIAKPLKFPDNTTQNTTAQPVSQQNVVTGSRALNIVYQNNTGRPMFISLTMYDASGTATSILTDASNPPTTVVALSDSSNGSPDFYNMFAIVLPGNYYKVTSGGTISIWTEWS